MAMGPAGGFDSAVDCSKGALTRGGPLPGGAQVCTELQVDWSRTRVDTATFKTISGGLFFGLFLTNVELTSN